MTQYIKNAVSINEFNKTDDYREFIRWALKYADEIELSYSSDYSAFRESELWNEFKDSIAEYGYDDSGTLHLRFRIDHVINEFLKSKKCLCDYPWSELGFLEDLSFIRNGETVLDTVSHENRVYISPEMLEKYKEFTGRESFGEHKGN